MKKTVLYALLFSGIVFMAGAYIYKQYQYKKFENFFMGSRIYGSKKMIIDTTFAKSNKKLGLNVKDYKYLFFLKNKKDSSIAREFFLTRSFDQNFKIVGGGGLVGDFFNIPIFHIQNRIYTHFISEKWIPNKKVVYYIIVEYEKERQIQYYVEIIEKLENKKYTIYFKSYPPKKILNAKNQYIKD
ncbi:hypothetical protein [Chryseobacterium sp. GVT01B]|uniref:hypothetical protein n=1 Tax=Chryseobacterium sp. GVT01B TaxID=2862675 RepID=UPI001CBB5B20|nr:hypothetical protein [Chryseobacterium sp. GVT01B]